MDIKLNYIEKGKGTPLVLLHGNGGSLECFRSQIEYFSKKYRVIALDTRGHGKSPRGDKPFTIKQFADDLKDFLDELGIKRVILLGFSDGGNIALTFALKYGEYVEKLILNGANLFPKGLKAYFRIPIEINCMLTKLFSRLNKCALKKYELLSLMTDEPNISFDELKNVTAPTLVIVGSADMIKHSHSLSIENSLPDSAFVVIKGTHGIVYQRPDEFNKAVDNFLNS